MADVNEPHAHQRLKLDDLPEHARDRLAGMRKRHFFTSDLSVNEFLLVKEARFQPLGLVMGSSIYQIGAQSIRSAVNEELTTLTQAMYSARELAMTRLEEEADALGADGVVAVRLDFNLHTWSANVIEFLAIGTAVKSLDGGFRGAENRPFTSDLSGQDFWTLLNAGYRPLGLVLGNCVYNVGQSSSGSSNDNQELTAPTQALYDARELAMERMQVEAEALEAAGIVGVVVDENNHNWGPGVIEFSAVGTAVVPIREDHHIAKPDLVLTVGD